MKDRIGSSFTDERENFLNTKFFEIKKLWDSVDMNPEEDLWMVLNFLADAVMDPYYDKESGEVDTTLAHTQLDRIIRQMSEMIDSGNDRLQINEDKK